MSLLYLYTPVAIFKLPDLNIREKLLLGLVMSFYKNGLGMSNGSLGEILGVAPKRLTYIIQNLKSRGYITIINPRSKYRKIYFNDKAEVSSSLLPSKSGSEENLLQRSECITSMETLNITSNNFNKKNNNTSASIIFSFENKTFEQITPEQIERWSAAYPAVNVEDELRRAAEWILANPNKRKSNWARFINNWLSRAQQKKGVPNYGYTLNRQPAYTGRPGEFIR